MNPFIGTFRISFKIAIPTLLLVGLLFNLLVHLLGCANWMARPQSQKYQSSNTGSTPLSTFKTKSSSISKLEGGSNSDVLLKHRLLVLPFLESESPTLNPEVLSQIRQQYIYSLNKTGGLIALSGDELKLNPNSKMKEGEYDMVEFSKLGKTLGMTAILEVRFLSLKLHNNSDEVGLFKKIRSQWDATIRMRMYSARSSREIFQRQKTLTLEQSHIQMSSPPIESKKGPFGKSALNVDQPLLEKYALEALFEFSNDITAALNKLSWEGRIAMVSGERIFLNVGQISGLEIGDLLKVSDMGEEIYDPQSGNYIGRVPGRIKGTLEVLSFFGRDGSIAIIHSGSGFKENDHVELY